MSASRASRYVTSGSSHRGLKDFDDCIRHGLDRVIRFKISGRHRLQSPDRNEDFVAFLRRR
jgi:hypothetical protein